MVHVINGLGKISGAERALLRVVTRQTVRPLCIISLREVAHDDSSLTDLPEDVTIHEFHGPVGLLGATIRLTAFLARHPATTVLCWMYRSSIAGAIATLFVRRHRLIWNIRHSITRLKEEPARVRLSIWLSRALSGRAFQIFYNSDRARQEHEAYGFPADKSVYVPNGFAPGPEPALRDRHPGCFVIGHAGRLTWEKDIETLISAFSSARARSEVKLKLIMVGPGYDPKTPDFSALLTRYGVDDGSVEGRGKIDDMSSFFREIDLFALSSVSEGFPNVLAEAQLHTVPCLTTDVGDAAKIVGSDFGWIVPPQKPGRFAEAILDAAARPPACMNEMGKRARRYMIERFSLEQIVAVYDAAGAQ